MARVLLVEDDIDLMAAFAGALRSAGHEVRTARNGAEGLSRLDDGAADVVVTDVDMPVLGGREMALRIREHAEWAALPIILMSATSALPGLAAEVGTPYYLPKPFAVGDLRALVNRALAAS